MMTVAVHNYPLYSNHNHLFMYIEIHHKLEKFGFSFIPYGTQVSHVYYSDGISNDCKRKMAL